MDNNDIENAKVIYDDKLKEIFNGMLYSKDRHIDAFLVMLLLNKDSITIDANEDRTEVYFGFNPEVKTNWSWIITHVLDLRTEIEGLESYIEELKSELSGYI